MLTIQEIIVISKWLEEHFVGEFQVDFAKGFEDIYILISVPDETAQHAYKMKDILKGNF